MSTRALIALGSNLGDREAAIRAAVEALGEAEGVSLLAVSRDHETPPVGGPGGQGAFLNAAASLETTLDPPALHRLLLDLERRAGRVRQARWGARSLDLDLILFGDRIIETPALTVPHPRFAVRRFVLAPLAEIAPGARDPGTGRTALELLLNLDRRPSVVAIDGPEDPVLAEALAWEVAASLGSRSLFGAPVLDLTDPTPARLAAHLDRVAATAESLIERREAWYGGSEDSWLVSDIVPSREFARFASRVLGGRADEDLIRRLRDVQDLVARAPAPTFLVLIGPRRAPEGCDERAPSLVLDRGDLPGMIREVLAACEASRAGSGRP